MSLAQIPPWVAQYVGIPYLTNGRTLEGCDCWGLYALVMAHQRGLALPAYDGPGWRGSGSLRAVGAAAEAYAAQFTEVPQGEEQLTDAILLRSSGLPIHIGMVVAPGLMLHVEEYHNSEIARYTSLQWASRIVSFFRYNPHERNRPDP